MTIAKVSQYVRPNGRMPVDEWLRRLANPTSVARIQSRIDRLSAGLRGDWKYVGHGVFELRIDFGAGYRVYFGQDGASLIILLCGGAKHSQSRDIERAHAYWKDYKERTA